MVYYYDDYKTGGNWHEMDFEVARYEKIKVTRGARVEWRRHLVVTCLSTLLRLLVLNCLG